jgi:acyl-CoA thioesterase
VHQFDQDIEVIDCGDGKWQGHISSAWNIGENPNGGYLVSIAINALAQSLPHPDPVSVTTHYLRPGNSDEDCEIDIHIIRIGRTLSTARASLSQKGKVRLEVLAVFGDLSESVGTDQEFSIHAPKIVSPEKCPSRDGSAQGIALPIAQRLDTRLDPDCIEHGKSDKAELNGWNRFLDGREPDSKSLPLFCDTVPPSPFAILGVVGWVPTIELTVHVRRRPSPGWIQAQFKSSDLYRGRMIEDGCLWDSTGALVAQSRQIGLVLQATE